MTDEPTHKHDFMSTIYHLSDPFQPSALRDRLGLFTSGELAAMLELSEGTLTDWRKKGRGPLYVKVGRKFFYRQYDIDHWLVELRIDQGAGDSG